eukprot:COSAG01_NODE_7_length_54400_cov_1218.054935_7_plen_267_part_00
MSIPYPNIDPICLQIGPFTIHWYGIAYCIGIISGYLIIKRKCLAILGLSQDRQIDLILFICIGIMIGGRLGYVLCYDALYYLKNPLKILFFWQGGMSFHGACLGIFIMLKYFSKHHKLSFWRCLDLVCLAAPIGIGLGRLSNFINAELYGRITSVPWAMVFPTGGPNPRHPSQLYEALLEGLVLGFILWGFSKSKTYHKTPGSLACCFAMGYSLFRFIIEYFREPDPQLGVLWLNLSMGQYLSLLLFALGLGVYIKLNALQKMFRF